MAGERKRFKRETADQRQQALIDATLELIAKGGPDAATVRTIAESAGVTQGLIRHYFSTKEELISAAYEQHMTALSATTYAALEGSGETHLNRLAAVIIASLTPPVIDPRGLALWAGFMNTMQRYPNLQAVHQRTYFSFRDQLERLIAEAWQEAGKTKTPAEERAAAIACNALIDGLWIEGGALPDSFSAGELPEIGLASLQAILDLDFSNIEV